ncbi:hypothetical protein C5167_012018 [Papaver somniferum]|uniref:Uncharacterized protein n=1 Tax=Papaver somniferum TaxID=3469 RepID=A0A4Y7IWA8_PAPSO|nr:hypothetical protein C5167_012018 [Papaver somniferum]
MEILSIPDTVNVMFTPTSPQKNLGYSKYLINRRISSGLSPIDAIAPPIVRRNLYKSAPRTLIRKRSRTRRRSLTGGDSDDGGDDGAENGFFGDDGPFGGSGSGGGGGGGGGGRGWSYGGGSNWDDDEDEELLASADPAFDFVYESAELFSTFKPQCVL